MESTLHRVLRWGPLSLLVLVPLLVYYGTFYHNEIKDLVMVGVVSLTSLGWLWVSIVEERIRLRITFTRLVLAVNVLIWVVALLASPEPAAGLFPLSVRLAGVGLVLFTPVLLGGKSDIKLAVGLLLGTGALMAAYGILQLLDLDPFFSTAGMEGHFRVRSTAGHPNFFVTFLSVCIALNIAGFWLFGRSTRTRLLLGGALVLSLVAAVGTMSRAGWGALLVAQGSLAVLLWLGRKNEEPGKARGKLWLGIIGLGLLAGVVSVGLLAVSRLDPGERQRVTSLRGGTLDKRIWIYRASLDMAVTAPVLGKGLGMFGTYLPAFRSPELARYYPRNDYHVAHAISEPLEVLVESGVLGLLAWLALIGVFVLRPIRAMFRAQDPGLKAVLAAVAAGMFGIATHCCVEVLLRHQPIHYLFWALPGLALAAEQAAGLTAKPWRVLALKNWPARLGISAAVGMIFGLVFAYLLTDFVANVHVGQGRKAILQQDMGRADQAFRDALGIQASSLPARYQRAYALWKLGHLKKAEAEYRKVLARSPYYFDANHNLARVLYEQNQYVKSQKWTTIATKLNPYHVPSFDLAVRLALERKELSAAEKLARGILARADHHEVAHLALVRVKLAQGKRDEAAKLLGVARQRFPKSKEVRRLLHSHNL